MGLFDAMLPNAFVRADEEQGSNDYWDSYPHRSLPFTHFKATLPHIYVFKHVATQEAVIHPGAGRVHNMFYCRWGSVIRLPLLQEDG